MTNDNYIKTGRKEFDELIPKVKSFLEQDVLEVDIDGQKIRGYRSPDTRSIWIRDYSDMLRGIRYFEKDLKSTIDHFSETQAVNGRIFDYFTTFPEKPPCEKENWTKYVRVPVEADVEFRFIKAAFLSWQAHGDDHWIVTLLPHLSKALDYALQHQLRWDATNNLVKRPYTIDTWDFAYTAGHHDWLQFQIDERTFWGIFHGDNSGYYEALKILAYLSAHFGNKTESDHYGKLADQIKAQCNAVCWNGSFYTHFVKLNECKIEGVDESAQLSMANPMAINRGITNREQAQSILAEYQKRQKANPGVFAEWFSIHPPFPDGIFGDEKLVGGAYINGGIFPLAGGELALAAFENGQESYGVEILQKYTRLINQHDGSWLWYFPDGSPSTVETSTSPEATSTDGWGSTAMLHALIKGLAGIEDESSQFRNLKISPRWLAAQVDEAEVKLTYPASEASISYLYQHVPGQVRLKVISNASSIKIHQLIPTDAIVTNILINGNPVSYLEQTIEESRYVDLYVDIANYQSDTIQLEVYYQQ